MKKLFFCLCAMFVAYNLYAQDMKPFYLQSGKYYNIESVYTSDGNALSPKDHPGNWLHYYQKNADEHILEIISFGVDKEEVVSQYVIFAKIPKEFSVLYFIRDAKDYSFVDCFEIEENYIAIMGFFNHEQREEKYFVLGNSGLDHNEVKKMYSF